MVHVEPGLTNMQLIKRVIIRVKYTLYKYHFIILRVDTQISIHI